MTTSIVFIRHAAHDRLDRVLCGRTPGVDLGAMGREQSVRLAHRLQGEPLAAVYASPLERAQQTAAPMAAAQGLTVRTDEDLNELDVGAWSGASYESLRDDARWERWNRVRLQSRPPNGESLLEAQVRAVRFVQRVQTAHPDTVVAAVTHADLIKTVVCWAVGLSLDAHARLEVSPASRSRIVVGDWGARLWSCNEETA